MNPRGTFERVYEAIRRRVEAADFAPGDHLEPALLADDLNSSITPVRDALQRLVGERLVEASPGDGFRLPLLTEVALRQLYEWNSQLTQLALKARQPMPLQPAPGDRPGEVRAGLVERTGLLFSLIATGSGNLEHVAAMASLNSRLAMVRTREAGVIGDFVAELELLETALAAGDRGALRRLVPPYHRRRQRLADRLVVALQLR